MYLQSSSTFYDPKIGNICQIYKLISKNLYFWNHLQGLDIKDIGTFYFFIIFRSKLSKSRKEILILSPQADFMIP